MGDNPRWITPQAGFEPRTSWSEIRKANCCGHADTSQKLLKSRNFVHHIVRINPCPAEPGYTLLLQTVLIQIGWLLKKPTDLDLHCLSFSRWIYINLDQVIWLVENQKWAWHLNLFSLTRIILCYIGNSAIIYCVLRRFLCMLSADRLTLQPSQEWTP